MEMAIVPVDLLVEGDNHAGTGGNVGPIGARRVVQAGIDDLRHGDRLEADAFLLQRHRVVGLGLEEVRAVGIDDDAGLRPGQVLVPGQRSYVLYRYVLWIEL